MSNRDWARTERRALSDALLEAGPDAATLCQGWTTGDLVAHLVLREQRLDAAPGLLIPPLAARTRRIQRRLRESEPYPRLVERFRQGPPAWSPFAWPGVDAAANTVEFFVHHEDVRRARAGWEPRVLPAAFEELLWRRSPMTRPALRRFPVEITLVAPDGRTRRLTKGGRRVRVHGTPSELMLWAFGRTDAARVRMTGEAEAIGLLERER